MHTVWETTFTRRIWSPKPHLYWDDNSGCDSAVAVESSMLLR